MELFPYAILDDVASSRDTIGNLDVSPEVSSSPLVIPTSPEDFVTRSLSSQTSSEPAAKKRRGKETDPIADKFNTILDMAAKKLSGNNLRTNTSTVFEQRIYVYIA